LAVAVHCRRLSIDSDLARAARRRSVRAERRPDRVSRHRPAAHLRLVLGDHQRGQRARSRSLAHEVVLQRGGRRLRPHSYLVGVERGWITREQARERVLTTLRFFWTAPQGAESTNVTGHRGFYYHFLDMERGLRFQRVELSTIDTGCC
jgi:hypothetical protein